MPLIKSLCVYLIKYIERDVCVYKQNGILVVVKLPIHVFVMCDRKLTLKVSRTSLISRALARYVAPSLVIRLLEMFTSTKHLFTFNPSESNLQP